ncbi:MAG TPA: peptide deformylase [Anaerolineae bacterium]|jgi:peptide deformylase
MAIREIVCVDDARLRQSAEKVDHFTPELRQLAQDMLETMRCHRGVGLAGPQLGVMQRIFVAEIPASRGEGEEPHPQSGVSYVLVNPEIVKTSSQLVEGKEGCLSMPTWYGCVARPVWVEVQAQDLDGRPFKLNVDDLLARIIFHEVDHLNGILFTDHITDPDKLWQVTPEDQPATAPTDK